ncbi:MAG: hypothetical protein ACD_81C00040G0003 [uncultured bacterium]|uniref:Uncharacterized protein n=2 Tax=Candidatus Wolfeibacteriota TaxID=1752735 RepID=A0A0G1HAX0_9BACT|nr:MAG: hypothetical protein ACD_81C00040G0003 [uncultured bacterium]KKR13006.1 MAG: hypothetical protein UT41_C0001G0550 [Candidatus Wolfebacteria bacterium GW2011_GWC2_39_22]KKT43935.1 MAG: hypothetical protein UW32_C0001G0527 [Candidatus Wolfebacteria bacterium GW2011_GWE2_44_13]HBI25341.1 hypothetical protein [Candidatus Wolfebacteria bacterium]
MNIFFGLVLIVIGLSIFLGTFLFKLIFAFLLVFWGISLLVGKKRKSNWDKKTISREDTLNETVVLSSFNRAIHAENFTGGKVVMILSGGELDLREAQPEGKEIELEISAILSGIKIIVPKTWKVVMQGTSIIGGYESNTEKGDEVTLRIKGAAILGGVEIVN